MSLLRLRRWPDIPTLPPADMVDMARICALLSWRATAYVIIARILDMPKERVQEVLLMLHEQGCLNLQSQTAGQPASTAAATAATSPADTAPEPPPNSIISMIWRRLAARN